jgi:UDP-N-acetylmuramoyl-tripeptide--D-alanyl-D-alanine ligase
VFLNSKECAEALADGSVFGEVVTFNRVVTDSRQVQSGDLFAAIRGDNHDGNDFVEQAIQQGAAGVLYDRKNESLESKKATTCLFFVPDTTKALRQLAHFWRTRHFKNIPICVVAGSVGKTTTKEFLAAILRGKYSSVLSTEGSQNGFLGIPLTLLKIRSHHKAAVVEVGIDELEAMSQHLELVEPDYSIVTAIGPEHLEKLGSMQNVVDEEALALQWIAARGKKALVNMDEPQLVAKTPTYQKRYLQGFRLVVQSQNEVGASGLGLGRKIDPQFPVVEGVFKSGTRKLRVSELGVELSVPLPGEHNARNLLGAVAMGFAMGLNKEEVERGLQTFVPPWGRSETRKLKSGVEVFCDFYNSNPTSLRAALKTVTELAKGKRLFLCLGDMLELGDDEKRYHVELEAELTSVPLDFVYLVGERMRWLWESMNPTLKSKCSWTADSTGVVPELRSQLQSGDVLLIKGSRGIRLEKIWEGLDQA